MKETPVDIHIYRIRFYFFCLRLNGENESANNVPSLYSAPCLQPLCWLCI